MKTELCSLRLADAAYPCNKAFTVVELKYYLKNKGHRPWIRLRPLPDTREDATESQGVLV